MKKIGFVLSLLLSFSAFAQENAFQKAEADAKVLVKIKELKGKYLVPEPNKPEPYLAALKVELGKLGATERQDLLRQWVLEAVEAEATWSPDDLKLSAELGADMDFEYTGKHFDSVVKGDRLLHVVFRNETDKVFYSDPSGAIIKVLIRNSNVCLKNADGEKPSDVFVCEKYEMGGTMVTSKNCDELKAALTKRERSLKCVSKKSGGVAPEPKK